MRRNLVSTRSSRTAVLALSAALTLTVSACGGSGGTDSARPGAAAGSAAGEVSDKKNKVDVAFIQGMAPHHQGAIVMTDLAADRAENPKVKDLANRIAEAQDPEIALMKKMADTWGVEVSTDMPMDMSGMGMGMGDMKELESLSGPAFDRAFLKMMIPHHEAALPSSRTEIEQGANPQAKELAEKIIASQTAEIEEMQQLLTEL